MVGAGVSIGECLRMLEEEGESKDLRAIIRDIIEHVEAGSTLAKAMARHPKVFDSLYVNIVAAGESSGHPEHRAPTMGGVARDGNNPDTTRAVA